MRLPNTAHTSRRWRIHELTRDFRLEDVWALPTPGDADDFPRLVALIASSDPSQGSSRAARTLWAIRWKVGGLLGWDGPDAGHGSQRPTVRDRLPVDLRAAPAGPDFDTLPFTSLYVLDDEWAAEIVNRTVHGVVHIGWVPDGTGAYRGQMAVYVKPQGLLGTGYISRRRDLAGRTFQIKRRDVLVGEGDRLAALVDGFVTISNVDHRWSTVGLYDVIDQQIAACWLLPLDQRAFDAIWGA